MTNDFDIKNMSDKTLANEYRLHLNRSADIVDELKKRGFTILFGDGRPIVLTRYRRIFKTKTETVEL